MPKRGDKLKVKNDDLKEALEDFECKPDEVYYDEPFDDEHFWTRPIKPNGEPAPEHVIVSPDDVEAV